MEKFGISALPTKFLIDPNGKILAKVVGDQTQEIDTILSEVYKR